MNYEMHVISVLFGSARIAGIMCNVYPSPQLRLQPLTVESTDPGAQMSG